MSDATNTAGAGGGDDFEIQLLAELRELAAQLDPVPPEALAAARSAIAWRTMDAELAELVADVESDPQLAGVRSATAPTLLTFESTHLAVELEVLDTAGGRRLLGQLVPAGPAAVEIRHKDGTMQVQADQVGRFRADGLPPGPVSLRCSAGDRVVETDWFLV